jgi:hypothetical protein
MLSLLVGLSAAGCPSADTPQPTGSGLVVPDITGIDFPAAMQEALDVTFAADLRAAWAAHRQSLGLTRAGCPDFWVGDRDGEWRDHCTTGAGIAWSGELAWNDGLSIEGEEGSPLGVTTLGARLLDGAAQVDDEGAPLFGFSGTGDDSLYVSEAEGYVLGLELAYSGGANSALTARGDVHLPGGLIAGRFDSVSLDVSLDGPGAALPDECAGEPRGWISLRDSDAVWYDLVLQPRFAADATVDPFPNEPYSLCEGCGTLYVRGVESGQVCVDFSALFDGRLQPPEPDGYVLPLRAQQGAP